MENASRRPWVIAYLAISAVLWTGGSLLIAVRSPGLFRERVLPGPGAVEGYPEELALYGLPALAHWLFAAVDKSRMPAAFHVFGLLSYALANALIIWAEVTNPFFSSAVRIQAERGQHVISSGPYAFVRHPGYVAGAAFFISSSFALGSWLSLLPAMAFCLAVLRRARIEDAFLKRELPGYTDYASRVRYRLLPGVW